MSGLSNNTEAKFGNAVRFVLRIRVLGFILSAIGLGVFILSRVALGQKPLPKSSINAIALSIPQPVPAVVVPPPTRQEPKPSPTISTKPRTHSVLQPILTAKA